MARKRMFDLDVINQDSFYDLPMEAKAIYFLLGMEADDEGFINPKKILRLYGGNEDSVKILILKNYIIPFKSGVVVITDWKRNNYLQKDRIKPTLYNEEKELLIYNEISEKYELFNKCLTNVNIEEKRIEENRIVEIYNEKCTKLPQCLKITEKRAKAIKEFLKQYNQEQFEQVCIKANECNFLIGQNDRGWKADIDFLLRVDKATSILEGKYNTETKSGIGNLQKMYEREAEYEQKGNNEDIDMFSS